MSYLYESDLRASFPYQRFASLAIFKRGRPAHSHSHSHFHSQSHSISIDLPFTTASSVLLLSRQAKNSTRLQKSKPPPHVTPTSAHHGEQPSPTTPRMAFELTHFGQAGVGESTIVSNASNVSIFYKRVPATSFHGNTNHCSRCTARQVHET